MDWLGKHHQWATGMKGNAFPLRAGGRVAKAEVADGLESLGKDMSQVALYKLLSWEGLGAEDMAMGAVLPGEGDVGVTHGHQAAISDGGATHIGPQIGDERHRGDRVERPEPSSEACQGSLKSVGAMGGSTPRDLPGGLGLSKVVHVPTRVRQQDDGNQTQHLPRSGLVQQGAADNERKRSRLSLAL